MWSVIVAIILPTLVGFAIPFFKSDRARQVLWAMTVMPAVLMILAAMVLSSGRLTLPDVALLGIALCLPLLFGILGRAFGKPFAEIRQEQKDRQIQETFQ